MTQSTKSGTAEHAMGSALAAIAYGVERSELNMRKAAAAVMDSPAGEPMCRQLCRIGADLLSEMDGPNTAGAILLRRVEKSATWYPEYRRFSDYVARALAAPNLEKSAGSLLPAVPILHDSLGGGMLKTLTAGGALTGAALGSVAFLLSRDAAQTSDENAILMEKIKTYKKLKRDIEEDMSSTMAIAPKVKRAPQHYDV